MTKKDLIELLKDLPDDALIVVNGHSDGDGYDDCDDLQQLALFRLVPGSWRGKYIEAHPATLAATDVPPITAYVLR